MQYVGLIYTKNLFIYQKKFIYLKFICKWVFRFYLATPVACTLHFSLQQIEIDEREKNIQNGTK